MTDIARENLCLVCKAAEWKYKCASCLLKHCSLNCYKLHKDSCIKILEEPKKEERDVPIVPIDLGDDCFDYIPTGVLERLRTSERLKGLLANRHLCDFLTDLDSSQQPSRAIERAMQEPLFVEFADECLRLINPDHQTQSPNYS